MYCFALPVSGDRRQAEIPSEGDTTQMYRRVLPREPQAIQDPADRFTWIAKRKVMVA